MLRAHADEAGRGRALLESRGAADQFAREVAALERAEAAAPSAEVERQVAASARDTARLLGAQQWRALCVQLAVAAVARLAGKARAGSPGGAFYEQVVRPSGLLAPDGAGVDGWQASAQTLFLVRLLRLATPLGARPSDETLTRDELRLYLRWKVERARRARPQTRLDALRRLLVLEPAYPAAEAEARILAQGQGG